MAKIIILLTLFVGQLFGIVYSAQTFDVTKYGGKGDGKTDNTKAIASAISDASSAKGGIVLFPAASGAYITGPIVLKSNIILQLADNVRVKFSDNFDAYNGVEALISGSDLSQVTLQGGKNSVLDGSGQAWWKKFLDSGRNFDRPAFFRIKKSKQITLKSVTFENSPRFTVNPVQTDYLTLDHVTIQNPGSGAPNTDGIHPSSCRHMVISNCNVNTGDDGIVFTSGTSAGSKPMENVTVTNCEVRQAHGGIVFGTSITGGVRNIRASGLTFVGTQTGIRFKAYSNVAGSVSDVIIKGVTMSGITKEAITMIADYDGDHGTSHPTTGAPSYSDIHISDVTGDSKLGINIVGLPNAHFRDISLTNVHLAGGSYVHKNVDQFVENDVRVA